LLFEGETVGASCCVAVETVADPPDELLGGGDGDGLPSYQDSEAYEFVPYGLARVFADSKPSAGRPTGAVEIADPAGGVFDIRFEQVDRATETPVSSLGLLVEAFDEASELSFGKNAGPCALEDLFEERRIARQETEVQERCGGGEVGGGEVEGVRGVHDLVTDGEGAVPEGVEEGFREAFSGVTRFSSPGRDEDTHVGVASECHGATSEASDGDEGDASRDLACFGEGLGEHGLHDVLEEHGLEASQGDAIDPFGEALKEVGAMAFDLVAEACLRGRRRLLFDGLGGRRGHG
jgi:hypothetical protein